MKSIYIFIYFYIYLYIFIKGKLDFQTSHSNNVSKQLCMEYKPVKVLNHVKQVKIGLHFLYNTL